MNKLLALLAYVTIGGFIAILAFKVGEPDLMVVAALTMALVTYDFATSANDKKD